MTPHELLALLFGCWVTATVALCVCCYRIGRTFAPDPEVVQELAAEPGWGKRAWEQANGGQSSGNAGRAMAESAAEAGYRHPRTSPPPWWDDQPPIGTLVRGYGAGLPRPPRPSLAAARVTDIIAAWDAETETFIAAMRTP